jgi:hypothetical protein
MNSDNIEFFTDTNIVINIIQNNENYDFMIINEYCYDYIDDNYHNFMNDDNHNIIEDASIYDIINF